MSYRLHGMERTLWRARHALFLLVALLLAGCEAPVPVVPAATLRIGVYSAQDYLPFFVMQDQGIARQYGLNFTEMPVTGGAQSIELLAKGQLDIALAALVPVLAAAERGQIPEMVVPVAANNFADPEHPSVAMMIANPLQGAHDLTGKAIGTNAVDSLLTAAASVFLKQNGVDRYSFLAIGGAYRGLALAGGNVAAVLMSEPYLTQALQRGDGKLLAWVVGGPPFERMELSSILFGTEFRKRNPAVVKSYLRAHLAAVRWINTHPEMARQVLAKRLNMSPEVALRIRLSRWPADARGEHDLNDQSQQQLLQAGLIRRPFDTRVLYDESLLTEVLKESR